MLGFGSNSPIGIPTKTDAIKYKKAHELLTSQRMSKVVKLKNGEQMGWAEVGDKNGIPVIWFSGPCSNRFIIAIYNDICIQLGIRLIAFDRPGRGASTPLRYPKDWSFASWASYIDEATDILEIPQFYVVGHSFGCSYIMASYDQLKHKIVGGFRFLATWAPSNLPCMPTSYALQRSLPTKMIRALTSFQQNSTISSLSYQATPCQMGAIGNREKEIMNDFCNREILERLGDDHLGDSYAAYELDWLLALEVQKPLGYNHRSIKVPIKCWHGMDDSITPLGAAMWMQREMDSFLLYAVEGATHNIHLDLAIVKAMFADICAENLAGKARVELKKQEENTASSATASSSSSSSSTSAHAMEKQESNETLTNSQDAVHSVSDAITSVDPSVPGFEESEKTNQVATNKKKSISTYMEPTELFGWKNIGKVRPSFAFPTKSGEESVWDYPRPPALVPDARQVQVVSHEPKEHLLVSSRTIRILETASPPTFYIPKEDVEMSLFELVDGKTSFCEWKGRASYWRLKSSRSVVAWSYESPNPRFAAIKGYLSFYASKVACYVDGEPVTPQPSDFYGGWVTSNIIGPFKGDPSIDWSRADSH